MHAWPGTVGTPDVTGGCAFQSFLENSSELLQTQTSHSRRGSWGSFLRRCPHLEMGSALFSGIRSSCPRPQGVNPGPRTGQGKPVLSLAFLFPVPGTQVPRAQNALPPLMAVPRGRHQTAPPTPCLLQNREPEPQLLPLGLPPPTATGLCLGEGPNGGHQAAFIDRCPWLNLAEPMFQAGNGGIADFTGSLSSALNHTEREAPLASATPKLLEAGAQCPAGP